MGIPITSDQLLEFRPPALIDHETLSNVVVKVRVPTPFERDNYVSKLLTAGIVQHTRDQISSLTMAGIVALYEGDEREEYISLLELAFAYEASVEDCNVKRANKLREMTDLPDGAQQPTDKQINNQLEKIKPEAIMSSADRNKIIAVQMHVQKIYQPLVKAMSDLSKRDANISKFNVQHYVADWDGLEHRPDAPCGVENPLQEHEINYFRTQIGKNAFNQVANFILMMQSIDEDEEKNLSLLLENMSAPIGSQSITSKDQESSTGILSTAQGEENSPSGTAKTQKKKSRKKAEK